MINRSYQLCLDHLVKVRKLTALPPLGLNNCSKRIILGSISPKDSSVL